MSRNSSPAAQVKSAARPWVALFIAVCLVSVNMRMSLTGVGPVLDDIAADRGVSPAALGMLASIPLLTWAAVCPLAQWLAARIGLNAAVSWALVALGLGTAWRSLDGSPLNLWLGTVLIGTALAITNVLLPATIKRDFGTRVPLVMGIYSGLLSGAAAIGAGITAPIAHAELAAGGTVGWRIALLATGASVPLALVVWVWATRRAQRSGRIAAEASEAAEAATADEPRTDEHRAGRRVWADRVAWSIAFLMGSQSLIYFTYANWLSPIDLSHGTDAVTAGLHVTVFHTSGMIASLVTPLLARGAGLRRILLLSSPALAGIGAVGISFAPAAIPVWAGFCGFSCGMALSLSLMLMVQRTRSPGAAAAVSGMSQSVGYLIASVGPLVFGWVHELSGDWVLPLGVVLVGVVVQLLAALALLRERMVFSPRPVSR